MEEVWNKQSWNYGILAAENNKAKSDIGVRNLCKKVKVMMDQEM